MAVSEPAFTSVLKEGDLEVRDYPALVAAEVHVTGDRDRAGNAGFLLLAGYIFGNNTQRRQIAMTAPVAMASGAGQKIAMTAPVAMAGTPDDWVMQFFMPAEYTLDTLPMPYDSRVKLVAIPATRVAVIRFSGIAWESGVNKNTARLAAFVEQKHYRPQGQPVLSRYNPPWTLWFLRRNEIWQPIAN